MPGGNLTQSATCGSQAKIEPLRAFLLGTLCQSDQSSSQRLLFLENHPSIQEAALGRLSGKV